MPDGHEDQTCWSKELGKVSHSNPTRCLIKVHPDSREKDQFEANAEGLHSLKLGKAVVQPLNGKRLAEALCGAA